MSTIDAAGNITQLSVSQVESFDPKQNGGCERRWFFERKFELKPDQSTQQSDGDVVHGHLANYLSTGLTPQGRIRMGKVVRGVIAKGELPKPGGDLNVEGRFDGQAKYDAAGAWIPLDVKETISIAGIPFEGFIDLSLRRGPVPEVWDHKTSATIESIDTFAKPAEGLIRTVQMPVYVWSEHRYWPDAKQWRIVHHNISRTGVHSFIRAQVVSFEQVRDRVEGDVTSTIERMKVLARADDQNDVPFNRKACSAWLGCPHQSICRAFKENQVQVDDEEAALFNDFDKAAGAAPAASDEPLFEDPVKPPEVDDEEAAAAAALAAIKLKKAKAAEEAKAKAAEAAKPKRENMQVKDVLCAVCGAALSNDNASKLRDGVTWKHIGCPKDPEPAKVTPPDAPASNPALASEQPKQPAEPKARKPKTPTPPAEPAALPALVPLADGSRALVVPEGKNMVTLSMTIPAAQAAAVLALLSK